MKPYVVGITGGSASGKTTFCEQLARALEPLTVHMFHIDEYFKPPEERPRARAFVTGKLYMDDNHPETMDLPGLARDVTARIAHGDCDVILVEGLLTLWDDEIRDLCELKLFVDCPADERIVRRLKRNMKWGLTFDEISDVYLDVVRYRHNEYVEPSKWRADLILNGSSPSESALRLIAGQIAALRRRVD